MFEKLKARIFELEQECENLRQDNNILAQRLLEHEKSSVRTNAARAPQGELDIQSSPEEKINFFMNLFRGREDVYPTRWQNLHKGISGYAPVYVRNRGEIIEKNDREYLPVTTNVIEAHLSGEITMGMYPLTIEDKCYFLVADFDKKSWQEDSVEYLSSCDRLGISAAIEISRSGNGAHVWIFFNEAVDASLARKLGSLILTQTMESRPELGLDSYDRLFPSQDTLPKGGFGNLIALPLQKEPRKRQASVFVDTELAPYSDQWAYLSSLRKMSAYEVQAIISKALENGDLLGIRQTYELQGSDKPWELKPSEFFCSKPISGDLPKTLKLVISDLIYIKRDDVPSGLANRVLRVAAFHNPEFYKAQAMRFSTFDKPRLVQCAEIIGQYLALPRGCLNDLQILCDTHQIKTEVEDLRNTGESFKYSFTGQLKEHQIKACKRVLKHSTGIISAATAFGKTVVAASIITQRSVNTLIIVHRKQLLEQWKERLVTFLDIPSEHIGQIGGGKNKPTNIIDIAIVQSLNQKGSVRDEVENYGQVIVDECHHISAFSFERVMRKVKAKYVLGLTATPERKDGHHPILFMQCGPIRYKMTAKEQARHRPFKYVVYVKNTNLYVDSLSMTLQIHELYEILISDTSRNEQIVKDILFSINDKRSPLILTERTEHVQLMASKLEEHVDHVIILKGGMGVKQTRQVREKIESIPENESRVIVATGSYIGEGFDDSRLDTLFLAMPISWKGTLQQYVGRLHRLHEGKSEVRVYDYVDSKLPIFASMFKKRQKGYADMGYEIYHSGEDESLGISRM